MHRLLLIALCGTLACQAKVDEDPDADTDSDTEVDEGPRPAELAALSSGECPDLSASNTSSFLSSDESRTATVVIPTEPGEAMPVVFFLHGLMSPQQTPEPTAYMANAMNLQGLADDLGVVFVLPESPLLELLGYQFFLWDIVEETNKDMVLYDDLRTCVGTDLDVDLSRVSLMGFSGGSLYTTILLRDRADTLASVVQFSGGSDVDASILGGTAAVYGTPTMPVPTLLTSGGGEDVWPSPDFVLVDFAAATDTLQGQLVGDGHFVVRCRHDLGHTIPAEGFDIARDWMLTHRYGVDSPYVSDGIDSFGSWCEIAQ